MGLGRKAAQAMKTYLGIRDTDTVYHSEPERSADKMFGIDVHEKNFSRIRVA